MNFPRVESITIAAPTAPASGATATLFDSAAMFWVKSLRQMNASLLEVTFHALSHDSAASGLKSYTSIASPASYVQNNLKDDSGTDTMPVTIAAADAPRTYRFILTPFEDFQLKYTNSANTLTSWGVSIVLHCNGVAVQR